ncbi:MAG: GNAT family N-acetyltransferase [Bacteroidia bacterium]
MDYEFAAVGTDDESIREIANLLRIAFPMSDKYSDKFIEWQYRDNPDGKIIGFNAYYNKMLVAHYAVMPMIAIVFGKEEKGLLSLNTATHPEHQGKKLFTTLAEMSYRSAAEQGYGFVVGVANGNSTHGFINKLGFQLIGKLDAKLGFGKIKFKDNKDDIEFEKSWTEQSLRWRLANPENKYKIKNNKIYSVTDKMGIEAILFNAEKKYPLTNNNVSTGFRPMKLWIGIDNAVDWKRSFYFNIPDKMRPSPLNFIFKDLTTKNRTLDNNKVKFDAIDFDAY